MLLKKKDVRPLLDEACRSDFDMHRPKVISLILATGFAWKQSRRIHSVFRRQFYLDTIIFTRTHTTKIKAKS